MSSTAHPVPLADTRNQVTDTHIRFSFHCTNCTEWLGGGIDPAAYTTLAWATSIEDPVAVPADATSPLSNHPVTAFFGADFPSAHLSQEEYLRLSERTQSTFAGYRERIYLLFEKYLALKRQYGHYDRADRCVAVNYLLISPLKQLSEHMPSFKS